MTGFDIYEFMISETFKTLKSKITKIQVIIHCQKGWKVIDTTEEFAEYINLTMKQLNTKED